MYPSNRLLGRSQHLDSSLEEHPIFYALFYYNPERVDNPDQ